MPQKLNKSQQIYKLANDLGIQLTSDPITDILAYCGRKIEEFLKDFEDCSTLNGLLDCVANKVGTKFEIAYTDDDLEEIKQRYLERGEKAFVRLREELPDDVFGVTFRLMNREDWEGPFVSVIDCRGDKASREYFTKWHEVAHLLVLVNQTRVSFKRTHGKGSSRDPEEDLMDVIAGQFGFYAPIVNGHAKGNISFEAINALRQQLCPESSQQASLIGFVKVWPSPCLLVHAEMGFRKDEEIQRLQMGFYFVEEPVPMLRAIRVTPSTAAYNTKLAIFENMRVPEKSIIHRAFSEQLIYAEAEEDLSWWETSDGTILPQYPIKVEAKRIGNFVEALITPL